MRRLPLLPIASRRFQGLLLSIEDPEYPDHMREPKNLLHRGAEAEQHELLVQTLRVLEHLDEGRDSGTIDVPDGLQVQSELLRERQGLEKSAAEGRRRPQIHVPFHCYHLCISHVTNGDFHDVRSEEHTSELQSRVDLVCRLLLEKKKKMLCSCIVVKYSIRIRSIV